MKIEYFDLPMTDLACWLALGCSGAFSGSAMVVVLGVRHAAAVPRCYRPAGCTVGYLLMFPTWLAQPGDRTEYSLCLVRGRSLVNGNPPPGAPTNQRRALIRICDNGARCPLTLRGGLHRIGGGLCH